MPPDLLADLTADQRAAVMHQDGPLLILAGAGSGKTRVITRRVAFLLQQGVRPGQILAITFTNKAAGEMRHRVETIVPGNRVWVSTFHSLGARLLRQYADRLGIDRNFTIYDVDDRNKLVKEALNLIGADDVKFTPERIAGAISKAKNALQTPTKYAEAAKDFFHQTAAKAYVAYEKKLRAANAMDFDDLLYLPAMALRMNEELRADLDARFRYVLIDEYQDTNSAQYEIARRLSLNHPNLCVVGDPDQCLLPGTLVDTADGLKPIEAIRDGDIVTSAIGWGKTAPMPVEKVMVNPYRGKVVTVRVEGGLTIRATPNHVCFAVTDLANPEGVSAGSQGWSEAEPLEDPASSRRGPNGATLLRERVAPLGLQIRDGLWGRGPGVPLPLVAPPLATFGRPVGAAKTGSHPPIRFVADTSFVCCRADELQPGMIVPVHSDGRIHAREIVDIEWHDYTGPVYDLSVPHTRNFVANGLVVHNSIYKWRGSDIRNILDFERDFPSATVITLSQNYRSTPQILHAASTVIDKNTQRKKKALLTDNPPGEPVRVLTYDTGLDEAEGIVLRIKESAAAGKFRYRDHAIFTRINALTRTLEGAFVKHGVPFQIVKGLAFFDRKENKDVLAYLRLLVNPADSVSFLRVVNEPARGVGKTSLDRLLAYAAANEIGPMAAAGQVAKIPEIKGKAATGLRDFYRLLADLRAELEQPPHELIRLVLDRTGYRKMLADSGEEEDADRLANIEELITAAKQFHDEDNSRTIADFLEQITLASDVDGWDEQSDCVSVMTMHAAKGLEFPAVYVMACEQGILPHERSMGKDEDIEEERRLCFVGMTRAMKELCLTHSRLREFRGQALYAVPSMFLDELPPEVERQDSAAKGNIARSAIDEWRAKAGVPQGGFGMRRPAIPIKPTIPDAPGEYAAGQVVQHEEYGIGQVLDVSGYGALRRVKIRFAAAGEKTFVADKVKLKVVQRK